MHQLPRTVIISAPGKVNKRLHAMPKPYIGSCMKSHCISNPGHSVQTATHTQEFHKTYTFISITKPENIDVFDPAMWEDGHTMSSH
jgi:hypothetical protein